VLLNSEFDIRDLGATHKILEMKIHKDHKQRKLLSHNSDIQTVLKRFNISDEKRVSTPLAAQCRLLANLAP